MAQELTFGGKAVGLTFNPSNNEDVQHIKEKGADFIDSFIPAGGRFPADMNGEVIAMKKLAQRAAQEASMWAVKAETWEPVKEEEK